MLNFSVAVKADVSAGAQGLPHVPSQALNDPTMTPNGLRVLGATPGPIHWGASVPPIPKSAPGTPPQHLRAQQGGALVQGDRGFGDA